MSRDVSTAVSNEIAGALVRQALLAKLEFESADVSVWTGVGELVWEGDTYLGLGDLIGVSAARESAGFQANGVTLQLSGVPNDMIGLTLNEEFQNRPATVWLAFFDSDGSIIDDPVMIFRGRMDTMHIEEGAETCTIAVQVESRASILKRAKLRRWTHQDQLMEYPDDKGFEYVDSLQEKELPWRPFVKGL